MGVEAINARLKQAQIKVRVLQRGGALYLQATLPPKIGETANKQRQIALGLPNSAEGLKVAEGKALELASQLTLGTFAWKDWEKSEGKVGDRWIVKHAIEQFKKEYQATHDLSEPGWKRFWYDPALRKIPQDSELTEAIVLATVLTIPKNTWTRNQACDVMGRFCKWAGVECSLKKYKGKADIREINPPSKEQVEEFYHKLKSPIWKRIYARIAIFGIRPHEAWFWERRGDVEGYVTEGKTGPREVLAVFPKWAREWELDGKLPTIKSCKNYADIGNRCSQYFFKQDIPFTAYDLRHAGAIEFSVVKGAPLKLAAIQFGHSEQIHLKTYTKYLNSAHLRAAYDRIMREE